MVDELSRCRQFRKSGWNKRFMPNIQNETEARQVGTNNLLFVRTAQVSIMPFSDPCSHRFDGVRTPRDGI